MGFAPIIKALLKQGLWPCQPPCNTPIRPVKSWGTGESRFVQDLRAMNEVVQGVHPNVPNYSTILYLKDVFFCIPLHHDSQKIFAFEWEDPDIYQKSQFC